VEGFIGSFHALSIINSQNSNKNSQCFSLDLFMLQYHTDIPTCLDP